MGHISGVNTLPDKIAHLSRNDHLFPRHDESNMSLGRFLLTDFMNFLCSNSVKRVGARIRTYTIKTIGRTQL